MVESDAAQAAALLRHPDMGKAMGIVLQDFIDAYLEANGIDPAAVDYEGEVSLKVNGGGNNP
jgi:hypothetical protein